MLGHRVWIGENILERVLANQHVSQVFKAIVNSNQQKLGEMHQANIRAVDIPMRN